MPTFTVSFLGEGSPTQIDYRAKATLILTSLLEDLVISSERADFCVMLRGACRRRCSDSSLRVRPPGIVTACPPTIWHLTRGGSFYKEFDLPIYPNYHHKGAMLVGGRTFAAHRSAVVSTSTCTESIARRRILIKLSTSKCTIRKHHNSR